MKTKALTAGAVWAAGAVVSCAVATDYEWANTVDRAPSWADAANWTTGGAAATAYPQGVDDTASIPASLSFVQNLMLPDSAWPAWNLQVIGAISGGAGTQFKPGARDVGLAIGNPNGYQGVFRVDQARMILQSTSTAETTPTFGAVNTRAWTKLNNAGTEGKVVVESAFGEGRLSVNAGYNGNDSSGVAGAVEVRETGGITQEAKVHYGTATFVGNAKDVAGAVAPGAWMHLDASAAGTVELDGNGKVTRWSDVRGNGVSAGPYQPGYMSQPLNAPKVRANWANGLPAIDFGLFAGARADAETGAYSGLGWSANNTFQGEPAALAWSERRTDIREVFLVFSDSCNTNMATGLGICCPYLIGDESTSCFSRGNCGSLFYDNQHFDMRGVINGEVRVNGRRVSYDHAENYAARPYVVSVRGAVDLAGSLFGAAGRQMSGVNYDLRTGGILLGEVLVYTNTLTDAQRAATEAHLMAKWCDGTTRERARADLGLLDLSAKNASAAFTGGTFTVGELLLPGDVGTFTKTGDGVLEVGKMTPAPTAVRVAGGGFALRQRMNPAPDATKGPAADPQVWMDATKADSFRIEGGNVIRWYDWRTDLTHKRAYTTSSFDTPVNYPVRKTEDAAHPYVDFGDCVRNDASAAQAVKDYDGRTLEAFVVYRNHAGMTTCCPFAGDGFVAADSATRLQAVWYNSADPLSATFRQNGVTLNTQGADIPTDSSFEFAVYSCRLPAGVSLNWMACDRGGRWGLLGGGCDIAEVLYYDRRLTDAERRDTEAYLMAKWLGKTHPDSVRTAHLTEISFADGVDPVLATDEPLAVATVKGTGRLVKTGTGAATVKAVTGFDGLAVAAGSLTTTDDMYGDAYFHLDASDAASIEYAAGTTTGEIARWNDVRGNGRAAVALVTDVGNREDLMKYPRMNTSAGPGWAEGMPTVDFLTFARPPSTAGTSCFSYEQVDCASMRWVDENGSTAGSKDVREVHIVYCENGLDCSTITNGAWFGYYGWDSDIGHQFLRSGMGRLIADNWSTIAGNATMRIDGLPITNQDYRSDFKTNLHFHVFSLAMSESTHANVLCNDRGNCGAGGYRIAEVVVFTGATNAYTKFQAINDHLLKKWRDIGAGGNHSTLTSLSATGGALNLSSATGTLAPKDGATLAFAFRGPEDYGTITVDGAFVVPATGAVTLDFPDDPAFRPAPGVYTLLKATSLVGAENLANWTVPKWTIPGLSVKIMSDAAAGEIVLRVTQSGTVFLVR